MEAVTAASVAALTVCDMCKSLDRGMTIETIQLIAKSGGASGTYVRSATSSAADGSVPTPATLASGGAP